jgi:hypothetical protein
VPCPGKAPPSPLAGNVGRALWLLCAVWFVWPWRSTAGRVPVRMRPVMGRQTPSPNAMRTTRCITMVSIWCCTSSVLRVSEKQAASRSVSRIARSAWPSNRAPASEVIAPPSKLAATRRLRQGEIRTRKGYTLSVLDSVRKTSWSSDSYEHYKRPSDVGEYGGGGGDSDKGLWRAVSHEVAFSQGMSSRTRASAWAHHYPVTSAVLGFCKDKRQFQQRR